MKLKIGITKENDFIGQHFLNTFSLFPDEFEIIARLNNQSQDEDKLLEFVSKCDIIIYINELEGLESAQTAHKFIKDLINAANISNSNVQLICGSLLPESSDILNKGKNIRERLLMDQSIKLGVKLAFLVFPHVFGPFLSPKKNSYISTFSHQLIHNEHPNIKEDKVIKLIYVGDLIASILKEFRNPKIDRQIVIQHTNELKISAILTLLESYKETYLNKGVMPLLEAEFELNLFNTFRSYIDLSKHFPVKLVQHNDLRGSFVEVIRLNFGGQVSFSSTFPGVTRGNHYHTRKIERFAVIKGEALIQLRKIGDDEVFEFYLSGEEPSFVDMPIWYTHNIKNIGDEVLFTNFWVNEFYNPDDPDTFMEDV